MEFRRVLFRSPAWRGLPRDRGPASAPRSVACVAPRRARRRRTRIRGAGATPCAPGPPMLIHPNIDPVAFSIGPLAVRWYGLMYLVGFAAGPATSRRRIAKGLAPVTRQQFDDLLFMAVLGVILGGRLGYVLFYKPGYYLAHPLEIFMIWKGGMASHGGIIGVIVVMFLFARSRAKPFLQVADFVVPLIPQGLAFGRIGNFINGELWGR